MTPNDEEYARRREEREAYWEAIAKERGEVACPICNKRPCYNPLEHGLRIGEITIDYLELSVRSINACKKAGLKTVGDIDSVTDRQMLALRNFGRISLLETRDAVNGLRAEFQTRTYSCATWTQDALLRHLREKQDTADPASPSIQ